MSLAFRSFAFAVAFAWLLSSCSNTPPASDASGNPEVQAAPDAGAPQSNADQVGSVPEDMLADEKGVEPSGNTEAALNATDVAEVADAPAADPFADLQEKPKAGAPDESEMLLGEKSEGARSERSEPGGSGGSAGSGKLEKYTVQPGDTLMKIAFQLYGDVDRWKDLQELNREALKKHSVLRKGMKIRYEAPLEEFRPEQLAHSYQIKKGDTLAGIADDLYGRRMKYRKLQAYNKRLIRNPHRIFAGFTIFYDITEKEMAEAEARRAQKAAGGGSAPAPAPAQPELPPAPPPVSQLPSALSPPPAPPANSIANDKSAAPMGPPPPAAQ